MKIVSQTGLAVPDSVFHHRLKICDACPLVLKKEGTTIEKDGINSLQGAQCSDCGCFIFLKGRLKDYGCPINKW